MMTDVTGVLDKQKNLLTRLTPAQCEALLADGTISGGMIPKLETCLQAVQQGARAAHILDGRIEHVLLLEIFTPHGVGTMITRDRRTAKSRR
jgi:acetylglutamate kinase